MITAQDMAAAPSHQERESIAAWFECGARSHADALLAEQNELAGHPQHATTGVALYCERLYSAVLAPVSALIAAGWVD